MASSILGAVTGGIGDIKESLHVPFLEESGEEALKTAIPYLARLYRIFAKIFAKACGVMIAWSWSDAIRMSFQEKFVPAALSNFVGILYAILMTAFTTWMVKYISEGAGDPDNIEYGKFGQHSRELLLLCQPMMLAWAWKGFFIELLWEHMNHDDGLVVVLYRLAFAVLFTGLLAWALTKLHEKIKEMEESGEDNSYEHVAMSLLSTAFGLFIAWSWNQVSESLGEQMSTGKAATAVTTTLWAIGVTFAATIITTEIADRLRSFANSGQDESQKPAFLKFVDLFMVSLGYVVGWAWSDALTHVLIDYFYYTDMKAMYFAYSVGVTISSIIFSYHMATLLEDHETPRVVRQYLTLSLNALALMTGWAWKSYAKQLVKVAQIGGAGIIVTAWFQAFVMTVIACIGYHKICKAAAEMMSKAESIQAEKMVKKVDMD